MKGSAIAGLSGGAAVPVVITILGYRFEAGPLVITICCAVMTRLIVTMEHKHKRRWAFDWLITGLSVIVSALWVQAKQLELLPAGLTGISFGALGIGIITMAKGQVGVALRAALQTFLRTAATPPPRTRLDAPLRQAWPVKPEQPEEHAKLLGQLPDDPST